MKKYIGIGLLVLAVVAVVAWQQLGQGGGSATSVVDAAKQAVGAVPTKDPVTIRIAFGGEKKAFLADEQVLRQLARANVTVDGTERGSVEMVTTDDASGMDCLWPSNSVAVDLAKQSGKSVLSDSNVFNSPLVFLAFDNVTDSLVKAGVVEKRSNTFYMIKVKEFVEMAVAGKQWKEIGVNAWGNVRITITDPRKSNSGLMTTALIANMLAGAVVTPETLPLVLPKVTKYVHSLPRLVDSSGKLFDDFRGGNGPVLIAGYENQLVEFVLANPEHAAFIKQRIRILYPEPTVIAQHPLIALTKQCRRLQEVLQSQEVQDIAWRRHGFRTGLVGVTNDTSVINATGIPATIDQRVDLPQAEVMNALLNALNGYDTTTTNNGGTK